MKHIYIVLTVFLFIPAFLWSQVEYQDEKTQINKIKKNAEYIYGEGIAETEKEALSIAEQSLRSEVMRVISEREALQDAETVIVNAIKKNSSQVKLKRGTLERIFLYVSKKNIMEGDKAMTINRTIQEEPVAVVETPTIVEEVKEVVEEPVIHQPNLTLPPVVSDIVLISDLSKLQNYLKTQKEAHKIMWGKINTEINPAWYIVMVSDNEVKAVFDKGLNTRTNFLTGEKESISNYGNHTKIWFIVYE